MGITGRGPAGRRQGRRITAFDPELFVRGTSGRYVSIARSELAAIIYGALDGRVETIFGDSVRALDDDGARVRVTFDSGRIRDFDLVIGADGLHSQVRRLVFGPEEQFEKYLGITVAAFEIKGYRPRDELVAVMYTEVGYQVTRLSFVTTSRCSCSRSSTTGASRTTMLTHSKPRFVRVSLAPDGRRRRSSSRWSTRRRSTVTA